MSTTAENRFVRGRGRTLPRLSVTAAARHLRIWRSPEPQPRWARPALLLVAGLAALSYAWGANSQLLEPFYGAAARSMSESWHNFVFGAFDPMGTITVDKLPGALWLQALSLRVFGFHIWAVALPQIIEGTATVLFLYRAVLRLAGPIAAITAATVLAATPVTVILNRGNISDSLLILLTVIAADATAAAIIEERPRRLLLAALWVGLAFQAKMMQAWLVLPALALPYLLAAGGSARTRLKHLGWAGLVVLLVSLSWMSFVSLVPAGQRPYVDGSRNDSVFSQVFVYNGYARLGKSEARAVFGRPSPFVKALDRSSVTVNRSTAGVHPAWNRLLSRPLGRDWAWLLPVAVLAGLWILWDRRRAWRGDPMVTCAVMWTGWLLIIGAFFSFGAYLNSYYLAALAPAVAALCGLGAQQYWPRRNTPGATPIMIIAGAVTAAYGGLLLAGGSAVPSWVVPAGLGAVGAGIAATVVTAINRRTHSSALPGVVALVSLLAFPAATSALAVARHSQPFDVPYELRSVAKRVNIARFERQEQAFVRLLRLDEHARIPAAVYTSALAANTIFYTGAEVLPLGGYSGLYSSPTTGALTHYVKTGQLRFISVPISPSADSKLVTWVRRYCAFAGERPFTKGIIIGDYVCSR